MKHRVIHGIQIAAKSIWRRIFAPYLRVDRVRLSFANLLMRYLKLNWKLSSGLTLRIASLPEWIICSDIFIDGEYDLAIMRAITSADHSRPFRVLDLGGNVGYFVIRVAHLLLTQERAPKGSFEITSVEASPAVLKELQCRLGSEAGLAGRIRLVQGVVGKREGTTTLYEVPAYPGLNTVFPQPAARRTEVSYVDLCSLFQRGSEIDLLKCDIEGAELMFLQNYRELLSTVRHAVFEFHHGRCNVSKCLDILKEVGFYGHKQLRSSSTTSLELFWR